MPCALKLVRSFDRFNESSQKSIPLSSLLALPERKSSDMRRLNPRCSREMRMARDPVGLGSRTGRPIAEEASIRKVKDSTCGYLNLNWLLI